MYKKATRCKLRIPSKFGELAVEQLWDLSMNELGEVVKNAYAKKKKYNETDDELSFLNESTNSKNNKEAAMAELAFNIVKDVYTTRIEETKEAVASSEKKKELALIEELILKKKNDALANMSIEELEKKAKELNESK